MYFQQNISNNCDNHKFVDWLVVATTGYSNSFQHFIDHAAHIWIQSLLLNQADEYVNKTMVTGNCNIN